MKKQNSKNQNKKLIITKEMSILEIIDKKPEAIEVLFDFGLGCISCAFSQIESLEEGALSHGMSEGMIDKIVKEINKF